VHTLLARKNDVLAALLQPDADECAAWQKRAAIAEFDGGLSRPDAETLAWAELQVGRPQSRSEIHPVADQLGNPAATSGVGPGI
jgi:hypothetical protein